MRRTPLFMLALMTTALAACDVGGPVVGGGGVIIITSQVSYLQVRDALGKDTVSSPPGDTIQLVATALNARLEVTTGTWITHWSSRDTTVATVDADGLVSTVAGGDAWIVAWIKPDSSTVIPDSALVRVIAPN